ncbi:MAG TPA: hypothetical protein VN655_04490 [Pseudolabrys sp.]|nr:hypothetical protein [Pseudolabrys sp.]
MKIASLMKLNWAILAGLMLWSLTGQTLARDLAMSFAVLQALRSLLVYRDIMYFPTQLRIFYVVWMAAGLVPHLFALYLILTAGTAARALTGYCAMARLLLLMPWNRSVPLTWRRIKIIAFHPPVRGSVVNGLPL